MICDKIAYDSPNDPRIKDHKVSVNQRQGTKLTAYKCPNCPFWHLANPAKHNKKHQKKRISKKDKYPFDYRNYIHPKP
jgi:hypothetical protein